MQREPCPEQPTGSGCLKRVLRRPNSTSTRGGGQLTTITSTFYTTIAVPVSTQSSTPTSSLSSTRSSTSSFPSILPSPSSLNPTLLNGEPTPSQSLPSSSLLPAFGGAKNLSSSGIIGITIAIVAFLFILASFFAWHKRRRKNATSAKETHAIRSPTASGVSRPSLHPRFSFENLTYEWPLATSGAFMDKFNRLNKSKSPGVHWVTDDHGTLSDQTMTDSKVYARSFWSSPTKATVVHTFITELDDELPVAVGQKLCILEEYDDGWTFCANQRGERGMVPVECLHTEDGSVEEV